MIRILNFAIGEAKSSLANKENTIIHKARRTKFLKSLIVSQHQSEEIKQKFSSHNNFDEVKRSFNTPMSKFSKKTMKNNSVRSILGNDYVKTTKISSFNSSAENNLIGNFFINDFS